MYEIFLYNCNCFLLVIKYMYVMLENEIKKMYVINVRNFLESMIFV